MQRLFTLLFVILFAQSIQAQDWLDGFIITKSADTLKGKIQYRTSDVQFQKAYFKENGAVKEYIPSEVLGYGIDGVKSYSSQAVDNEFVEVIAVGNVSLYRKRKTLLIQNENGETYPLVSKTKTVVSEGETYVSEGKKWKSIVYGMLSSCDIRPEDLKELNFNTKNILGLVTKYNACKNGTTKTYQNNGLKTVLVDYGIHFGIRNGELNVSASGGPDRPVDTNHKSTNAIIGGFLNFRFPNLSEKISLQVGLNYQTVDLTGNTFTTNADNPSRTSLVVDNYEINSGFSSLGVPISLKALLVDGNISVFAQSGIVFNQISGTSSTNTRVRIIDNGAPTTTRATEVFDFDSSAIHPWARIGISKSILGKYKVGLAFDFIFSNDNLLLNPDKFSPFNQTGFSLLLSY
ncbi:hypothetical protein [Roseivirga misakiensis]|uniref:Outer membrane protein beta-barrel domain-containing protein n=1 Tax=Roseivirga misakiensis TaxID=1563681 RepID=A0A1E5SY68_9BACT|nr:hypothetical protein [Roseivirga misakiensis]OEK04061.1 hypothetical protein BFP71_11250 [Roseivirga misakiensis]